MGFVYRIVPCPLALVLAVAAASVIMGVADSSTSLYITNSCPYTVWAVVISSGAGSAAATAGFELAPGLSHAVPVPSLWSGRLWGRRTDDYGFGASCHDFPGGNVAAPPVTLVEFSINESRGGIDFYSISLVDGYNLPILVEPQGAAPAPGGSCMPAACVLDLESDRLADLRVTPAAGTGAAVAACASACLAFGAPWYCCTGAYGSADTCRASFKKACPQAITYAYDADAESVFTCRAAGEDGICYTVTFCPPIRTSGQGTGSNQPTRYNGNSQEVGTAAGSDPVHVSLIVAVLGGVTALLGLVAAALGVWKSCCISKQVAGSESELVPSPRAFQEVGGASV